MAMVMRANDNEDGLGGHISSFGSSATLYDVGMNYFFGVRPTDIGRSVFYQGHSAPGMYARSYLEGVFDESHLENFRERFRVRPILLPPPVADAELLAVPYCIDGSGSDSGDLSSPCHEISTKAWFG